MNKKTSSSRLKTFLLIITAIVFYAVALRTINFFALPYKGIIHLLLLLIIAVCVYIFMRYNLYVYNCIIKENKLVFISRLGEAEKIIAKVEFEKILFVAPANCEITKSTKAIYRYNARNSFSAMGAYVLFFFDEKGRISKLLFDASENLLKDLKESGINVM